MKRFMLSLFVSLAFPGFACAAVDLNAASKEELETVKGIGPVKAGAVIEHRKYNGPYRKVDDLKETKGFGDRSVDKMRQDVTVDADPASKARKK